MRLENNEIRIFQAVVEEGGFALAAKRLHLSQPAISQAVANLEQKLNAVLIERGRRMQLTPAGKHLFRYASDFVREESKVIHELDRIKQGASQKLSLAINSAINRVHAPEILEVFCSQNPLVNINMMELPSRRIIYAVQNDVVELGFGPFQKHMSHFETETLFQEKRVLVISKKHPLIEQVQNSSEEHLESLALITAYLDDTEQRPSLEKIRDRFSTLWEINSLNMRIHLIRQGLGVGYLSEALLKKNKLEKDLICIPNLSFGHIQRDVGLYYKKGANLNQGASKFINICRERWEK